MIDENIFIHENDDRYLGIVQDNLTLYLGSESILETDKSIRIFFSNCNIKYFTIISGCNKEMKGIPVKITFENCFFSNFNAIELEIDTLGIIFENCTFVNLDLDNFKRLHIVNSKYNSAKIKNIDLLELTDVCKNGSEDSLSILNVNEIFCQKSSFAEINILSLISTVGKIEFFDSLIDNFIFGGLFNSSISIDNCKINELVLDGCSFSNQATFYNIKPIENKIASSFVEVCQTNLNNVLFDNFFFNKYNKVSFYRNSFENVKFISCEFPESLSDLNKKILTVKDIYRPELKDDNYDKVRYETFIQLKNAVEKSGNYYEANKLKAASDEALKNIKDLPVWDKIILCLNGFSNSHGQSFGRTLAVFIFSTIFLYILYLSSFNVYIQLFTQFDMYYVNHYFSFIDITHKQNFLNPECKTFETRFLSLFIDYCSKIWIGYLIYQFISAFRKYAKK